ncbi:hypothetical protein R3I94_001273 [Phoxinus phoxinus]
MWQRLCETAKDFTSGSPDTEALACFFIRVIRSLAVHSPDLPFSDAATVAVEEWRRIPLFQREQYHVTARMFIKLEEQNKRSTGYVKKTSKQSKKALPVEDLAESALAEYSQVMDALGSEVTAADEEDVCALYFNQLFKHCEFTNEAGFDMDYISSLLSTDHNLTDVLKENSQDLFSSVIPKPVAGCSHWTPQRDFSQHSGSNLQDHMTQKSFRIYTPTGMENGGQNAFQALSSQGVQETVHSAFQDFGPSGNSSGGKSETLYVAELETTVQSECFSLQNYKSHHASFTHSIKHPKKPANGGVEHDGEQNTVARQKTEKTGSTMEKRNMDTDIPNDSQQDMRNNTVRTQTSVEETSGEKNLNQNKEQKRRRRRRKQDKITALDERTTAEHLRSRKTQGGQRRSATKHGAKETDFFKITTEREQLPQRTDVSEARTVRRDGEIERRQRPIKTERFHEESRGAAHAERSDGKEPQKWAIGEDGEVYPIARGRPKPAQTTNEDA